MEPKQLKQIIEGALLASGQALDVKRLLELFSDDVDPATGQKVTVEDIDVALDSIVRDCEGRGFELKQVGSGWRFQVREETAPWVNRLWEEKPQKYSRAMLETLALIAYRQPITRGDIEQIRGVAVSSHIIKTLAERDWVKVVGHRDVPGRPSLYATTKIFLDYFNLKSLEELPSLGELADIEQLNPELNLEVKAPQAVSESQSGIDDPIEGAEDSDTEVQIDLSNVINDEAEVLTEQSVDDVVDEDHQKDAQLQATELVEQGTDDSEDEVIETQSDEVLDNSISNSADSEEIIGSVASSDPESVHSDNALPESLPAVSELLNHNVELDVQDVGSIDSSIDLETAEMPDNNIGEIDDEIKIAEVLETGDSEDLDQVSSTESDRFEEFEALVGEENDKNDIDEVADDATTDQLSGDEALSEPDNEESEEDEQPEVHKAKSLFDIS